ncbi:hypothetical protein [Paenibacillus sp. FSL H7-0756]|uniref:hypothetical protein n=1 Tax=Paenibacillus sp. FSL H7-0756 TaxID=2954738 RepID=UPI0030F64479
MSIITSNFNDVNSCALWLMLIEHLIEELYIQLTPPRSLQGAGSEGCAWIEDETEICTFAGAHLVGFSPLAEERMGHAGEPIGKTALKYLHVTRNGPIREQQLLFFHLFQDIPRKAGN